MILFLHDLLPGTTLGNKNDAPEIAICSLHESLKSL